MPPGPCQWALSVNHRYTFAAVKGAATAIMTGPHWSRSSTPPSSPGREQTGDRHQQSVGDHRQQDAEHAPDDERGVELPQEAVVDELAEASLADEHGDGHQADGGDGGDAHAG